MRKLIGRKRETEELERRFRSGRSEFIIVYGRRRIGKTFLVNNVFAGRFTFTYVGARRLKPKMQLQRFAEQLKNYSGSTFAPTLNNWGEAFNHLRTLIESRPARERKVVFIDEMPWIDTPRSEFVNELEYFWNSWAAQRDDILFIACGSATSWMVNKLVKNRGGLHNRITGQIYLRPFKLGECEQYLHALGCRWDRYTMVQCYMVLGGVPYYMDQLDSSMSLAQNIDRLFFAKNAPMREEFDELFNALFTHADKYITVVSALAGYREGMLRAEVTAATKISGGQLTRLLENLQRCDFVEAYSQNGAKVRNTLYRISDPYTLFYFKFISNYSGRDEHWWTNNMLSHSVEAWQGFSFETMCTLHLDQIKRKLGINNISTSTGAWRLMGDENRRGVQIDLVIDRADRVINLCEIKFCREKYVITRAYEDKLRERNAIYRDATRTRKSLALTMITTFGVMESSRYSIVNSEVTMDDLFVL